ncbi:hypothetical protein ODI_R0882 [Orrella dioscoreae]|uniref:Uncharacterized protein n=1 Tax=Orrella dioscoreae TaxID=1851544 RepID=A0A1C3K100_9BURK|nr:hypothetical protein ODI_00289 [Orrella dioscoreae]SOE47510.1 hypothetical protein ODI_R0882 [Orrella dioscoreae]
MGPDKSSAPRRLDSLLYTSRFPVEAKPVPPFAPEGSSPPETLARTVTGHQSRAPGTDLGQD